MKKGRAVPRRDKMEAVDALATKMSKYPVVGVMSLHKVPADALQKIRGELSEAVIKVERKSVIEKALEKSGKADLIKLLGSQPAIIMSGMNPFKLYRFILKKKSRAAAKPGDIAPEDVTVPAGPTDIPPGPAISALTKVKIAARVEGGKIAVAKDSLVVKKGEVISADLASALSMLKVQPMEIGLDISALVENGTLYLRDALAIDETKILGDIRLAALQAFNLSLNSGYPTRQTIGPLITRGFLNAKTLGVDAGILDTGVIEDLLAKATRQAEALASKVPAQ